MRPHRRRLREHPGARRWTFRPETLRFIDSTFSHPSAAELAAHRSTDDAAPERDSLLELLFSPDEASADRDLERRLGLAGRNRYDRKQVIARLAGRRRCR
ncbi:MAG: hypothetical protein MZV70_09055 [Desulfobacterales bacterium]|nr:hypothetical protein [Desulfobacterales bacterium]